IAGAYMFIRKKVLDEVGLLDEAYFMYGEDIDLSYRIKQAGYENYYFPETRIIHYKGESTKKGSLNYVLVFYNAMIIFANKHFSSKNAAWYTLFINLAIYLRAALAVVRRFMKRIYRQVIDAGLIFSGFIIGLPVWESIKYNSPDYYPDEFIRYIVPLYIFTWLITIYYSGGYDRPFKIWNYLRGIIIGTFTILVIYALLPESLRFSRAMILLGTTWTLVITGIWRWVMYLFSVKDYQLDLKKKKRIVIVGEMEEAERVTGLLGKTQIKPEIIGYVSPEHSYSKPYIGNIDQLSEVSRIHKLDEILFCAANISSQQIIEIMSTLTGLAVNYKIAPPESLSIIGSNSINTAGELYTLHFNSIGTYPNLRSKRLFDILVSIVLILTFPFWVFIVNHPIRGLGRLVQSLAGTRTIVGYCTSDAIDHSSLPPLRKGILNPSSGLDRDPQNRELMKKLNVVYAKDYKVMNDVQILWRGFRKLGGK
ncbi:glycosyl transferase family 2, partial [Bacteroidota bacterium]